VKHLSWKLTKQLGDKHYSKSNHQKEHLQKQKISLRISNLIRLERCNLWISDKEPSLTLSIRRRMFRKGIHQFKRGKLASCSKDYKKTGALTPRIFVFFQLPSPPKAKSEVWGVYWKVIVTTHRLTFQLVNTTLRRT
jgi:hypothetical protein